MSIQSTCPGCGEVGVVPDHLKAKKVRCKKCQRVFVVGRAPAKSSGAALDVVLAEDEGVSSSPPSGGSRSSGRRRRFEDDEPLPRRRGGDSGGSSGLLITLGTIGLVGLVVIGGCGGLAYWGFSRFFGGIRRAGEEMQARHEQVLEAHRPPRDLEEAIQFTRSVDGTRRQKGAEFLTSALVDDNRRPEVARSLEPLLGDGNPGARDAGARALARWATRENVPALVRVLEHHSPDVRRQALEALGSLQDGSSAEAIAKRLGDWSDRQHAANALIKLGPLAEKEAIKNLGHRDDRQVQPEVRRVLAALAAKDPAVLTRVLPELKSPDADQRRGAAEWLAQLTPQPARQAQVVAALGPLLQDFDEPARAAGTRALGAWATRDNVPLLIGALNNPSRDVRKAAMTGLARLRDERGAAAVAQRLSAGGDRHDAAEALIAMGTVAEKVVLKLLDSDDFGAKHEASRILKAIGRAGVDIDEKLAGLRSPDPFARRRAVEGLAQAPVDEGRRREVAKALEPLLRDPDVNVGSLALRVLGAWGAKDNVPAIVSALNDWTKISTPTAVAARRDAILALAAIKDEPCVAPVAARLAIPADMNVAGTALVVMGPMVEGEVVKYLKPTQTSQTRLAACLVLQNVGTPASLPALQEVADENDRNVSPQARLAVNAIKSRAK